VSAFVFDPIFNITGLGIYEYRVLSSPVLLLRLLLHLPPLSPVPLLTGFWWLNLKTGSVIPVSALNQTSPNEKLTETIHALGGWS